ITPTGAGVGNTSPRVLLDVGTSSDAPAESSGLVGFFSTGGTARVSVRDSTNNIESTLVSGSSQGGIGTVTNHPFSLLQNNAVAATVGTNGYLGVNQPSPLHVL